MSALELKAFPPIPECPQPHWGSFAYEDWFTDRSAEMKLRDRKRLTDAELAAEYWREAREFLTKCESASERLDRIHRWTVMHRFATLPHYDEVTA